MGYCERPVDVIIFDMPRHVCAQHIMLWNNLSSIPRAHGRLQEGGAQRPLVKAREWPITQQLDLQWLGAAGIVRRALALNTHPPATRLTSISGLFCLDIHRRTCVHSCCRPRSFGASAFELTRRELHFFYFVCHPTIVEDLTKTLLSSAKYTPPNLIVLTPGRKNGHFIVVSNRQSVNDEVVMPHLNRTIHTFRLGRAPDTHTYWI